MLIKYIFRILWKKEMRARTLLAIAAISLGIAATISVLHTNQMLDIQIKHVLSKQLTAQITLFCENNPQAVTNSLVSIKNIKGWQIRRRYDTELSCEGKKYPLQILGIESQQKINSVHKILGDWPRNSQEMLLDHATFQALQLQHGQNVVVGGKKYRLSGTGIIPASPSLFLCNISFGYVPIAQFEEVTGKDTGYLLEIALYDYAKHETVRQTLHEILEKVRSFIVLETELNEMKGVMGEEQVYLLSSLLFIAGIIAFIVGAILVFQTVFRIVLLKIKDYGTLQSLGLPKHIVFGQIFLIAGIIGVLAILFGLILGVVLGNFLTAKFSQFLNIPFFWTIRPQALLFGATFGSIFCLLASLYPMIFLARQPIVSILKYNQTNNQKTSFRNTKIPLNWLIPLRQIFKSPFRTSLSLLFLVFATAAFIAAQTFNFSFSNTLDMLLNQYYHFDFLIEFHTPQEHEKFLAAIKARLPEEKILVEPFISPFIVKVKQSNTEEWQDQIALMGISSSSQTWKVDSFLSQGCMFSQENEVVVSERTANLCNIGLNQTITLEDQNCRRFHFRVVGLVKAYENRGLYIYGRPQDINKNFLNLSEDKFSAFAIRLSNVSPLAKDKLQEAAKSLSLDFSTAPLVVRKEQGRRVLMALTGLVFLLAILIAMSAIFGLATNITLEIWERTREISTEIALGISPLSIILNFIRQYILQSLSAWILSIFAGYALSVFVVHFFDQYITPIDFLFPFSSLLISGITIAFLCIGCSFITAYHAIKKLDVVQTLKSQT